MSSNQILVIRASLFDLDFCFHHHDRNTGTLLGTITSPTWAKEKSSTQKCRLVGDMDEPFPGG